MNFNLLSEKWIPVLFTDGAANRVSLKEVFTSAGSIRQLAAGNPMDDVAVLRFLLAILHWCKPRLDSSDRALTRARGALPSGWIGKLDEFQDHFDLVSGRHFYQNPALKSAKANRSVADLFGYFPADTEINHFRHIFDKTSALCAGCCAFGLLRFSACATQGGRGLSPSINNAPPIYFVPVGATLLETLLLNWPEPAVTDDYPAWETATSSARRNEIGLLEGFTWQPRAVWIEPPAADVSGRCDRCGATGPIISKIVIKPGRSRKNDPRHWRDPMVAYISDENSSDRGDRNLRSQNPLKYSRAEAALWRRELRAVLEAASGGLFRISAIERAQLDRDPRSNLRVNCYEPFSSQAKKFDEHASSWTIPGAIFEHKDLMGAALGELQFLDDLRVDAIFKSVILLGNADRFDIKAAFADSTNLTERKLRQGFSGFLIELSTANSDIAERRRRWRRDVEEIMRGELLRICRSIAGASRLRQQEAARLATERLRLAMNKLWDQETVEQNSIGAITTRA